MQKQKKVAECTLTVYAPYQQHCESAYGVDKQWKLKSLPHIIVSLGFHQKEYESETKEHK